MGAAQAHIDLSALRHNFQQVRKIVGSRSIMAMIKANAYGHGLIRIAEALPEADAFGVGSLFEAIQLREVGIIQPIVIMTQFDSVEQIPLCLHYRLTVVIHQLYQVQMLEQVALPKPLNIWLKLETGMHRLGLAPEEFKDAWQRLQRLPWIQKPINLMTHLACSDEPNNPLNQQQIQNFYELTYHLPGAKSIANSGALLSNPGSLADWVRPGIVLYGSSPFAGKTGEQLGLRPVMTLTASLIAVRKLNPNDFVGYGATYRCSEPITMGIVAIGYGDGYPRHVDNRASVYIKGHLCRLIGRVSMGMLAVDLRSVPEAKVGDSVILWGRGLPIERVAEWAGSIAYELFCQTTQQVEFNSYE